jgi:hypothetical protein
MFWEMTVFEWDMHLHNTDKSTTAQRRRRLTERYYKHNTALGAVVAVESKN